jgi:hypothetical protein
MRTLVTTGIILGFSAVLFSQQTTPTQQTPAGSSTQAIYQAQAASCQKKFDYIRQNGEKANPDQTPTIISESELNAWLASGDAPLPKGVQKLQMAGDRGVINATAYVDFDQITAGARSSNPLLSLFRGTHEVQAKAHASGSGGQGQVHIDSVSLDGVGVPRMALEYFVDKYIAPKYPGIGLDSQFKLPYRIDLAIIGSRKLTLTQK